jgi:TPR repeat protein
MYEAGIMSKLGRGTKNDYTVAYKMFSAAAAAGISYAKYEIGNCLFNGLGTVRNREQAYSHYLSAFRDGENNPKAAFMLGLCCLKGHGTELNEADAYEWFRKGAELGSRGAVYMKGECLFFGVGTEENKAAAVECYRRAISYEYDTADRITPPILALAQCYEKGLGVIKNPEEAMELYRKAAEFGDPDAWHLMGYATLSGIGVKAEYAAARNCFLRAARKESISAMKMMGWFADEGKGIPVNKKDACKWYTMVINKKLDSRPSLFDFPNRYRERVQSEMSAKLEAQYRLGILLPRIGGDFDSYVKGFEHLAQAASLDYAPAQTEVAKIYVHGGDLKNYYESPFSKPDAPFEDGSSTPDKATLSNAMNKLGDAMFDGSGIARKNPAAAARCYKISAELGCVDACYSYGWCLRHGQGVRENNAEAVKWLKLAADKGNANAAFSYGLCCEEGSGLDMKNKREALSYYRKAAASGHTEAMERYIKLSEQGS